MMRTNGECICREVDASLSPIYSLARLNLSREFASPQARGHQGLGAYMNDDFEYVASLLRHYRSATVDDTISPTETMNGQEYWILGQ